MLPFSRSRSNPSHWGRQSGSELSGPQSPTHHRAPGHSVRRGCSWHHKCHIPELQPAGICPGSAAYSLCNPGGCTGSQVPVLTYTRGCPPKSFRSHMTSHVPRHRWGAQAPCRTCAVVQLPCYRGTLPTHQPWLAASGTPQARMPTHYHISPPSWSTPLKNMFFLQTLLGSKSNNNIPWGFHKPF